MRITVKIEDIEVTIDRPNLEDASKRHHTENYRKNSINDSAFPALEKCIEKAKELYKLKIE